MLLEMLLLQLLVLLVLPSAPSSSSCWSDCCERFFKSCWTSCASGTAAEPCCAKVDGPEEPEAPEGQEELEGPHGFVGSLLVDSIDSDSHDSAEIITGQRILKTPLTIKNKSLLRF